MNDRSGHGEGRQRERRGAGKTGESRCPTGPSIIAGCAAGLALPFGTMLEMPAASMTFSKGLQSQRFEAARGPRTEFNAGAAARSRAFIFFFEVFADHRAVVQGGAVVEIITGICRGD